MNSISYQDLLKSQEELEQEKAKKLEQQVKDDVQVQERLNWYLHDTTKRIVQQLIDKYHELLLEATSKASSVDVSAQELRHKLVELQTIRKTVNLLRYGKYTESVSDGNTTSPIK